MSRGGLYDFIVKPIDPEEFKTRVTRLLEQERKRRADWNRLADARATGQALAELGASRISEAEYEIRKHKLDLETMIKTTQEMAGVNPKDLLGGFLLAIMGTAMASHSYLFLRAGERNETFLLRESRGAGGDPPGLRILDSRSELVARLASGKPVLLDGASARATLSGSERELADGLSLSALLPIGSGHKMQGVLALGPKLTGRPYAPGDLPRLVPLCTQFANSLENRKLLELRSTFSQYVSSSMIEYLMENPELLRLGGIRRRVAVMFADIRDFTGIAERLEPERVVSLLNGFFSYIAEVIFDHDGMLDKYIGDCVMAEFGIPLSRFDDAEQAARAALEIQRQVETLNREFAGEGYPEVRMGIAIHYGDVISGNLGSVTRMDYTVIGDTVNITARIEELAGPGQVLVSEELLEPIRNFVRCRFFGEESLRGRRQPVRIYELLGFHDEEVYALLAAREPWRVNHFLQVSSLNTAMGEQLGYSNAELVEFKLATLLLDIGRAELDPEELAADKPFTAVELERMHGIPALNRRFADALGGFSPDALDLMLHFHENYDGTGYPDRLKGRDIPEWARICRISDSWVAMTTPRPYRRVLEGESAREELLRYSGSHFDPALAVLFFEILAGRSV